MQIGNLKLKESEHVTTRRATIANRERLERKPNALPSMPMHNKTTVSDGDGGWLAKFNGI